MIHRRTPFLLLLLYSSIFPISAADTSKLPAPNPPPSNRFGDIALTDYLSSPSNFPALLNSGDTPALRPSLALIVGISTTVLFITFLLLLYAKHCKRPPNTINASNNQANVDAGGGLVRKNSGVDRSVIESLPLFHFSSLRGNKDGLECAVCLSRFNNTEVLRLIPKCRHAFHADCVDTWLGVHSTCPLCRHRIHPEDVLIAIEDCGDDDELEEGEPPMAPHEVRNNALSESPGTPTGDALEEPRHPDMTDIEIGRCESSSINTSVSASEQGSRRLPGRHSSAGERPTGTRTRFLSHVFSSNRKGAFSQSSTPSIRNSITGLEKKKRGSAYLGVVAVGCFDCYQRKDAFLLTQQQLGDRLGSPSGSVSIADRTRLEHQIIVSDGRKIQAHRWSDVHASDRLYLRSEMIISCSREVHSERIRRPQLPPRLPPPWRLSTA